MGTNPQRAWAPSHDGSVGGEEHAPTVAADRSGRRDLGRALEVPGILSGGEVAERLMAALLKSAESKDFVGSNPTLSATR